MWLGSDLVLLWGVPHACWGGGMALDLLSTGRTALERSQTGELDICLPEAIFWASKLKYPDRSSTELGLMALTLSSG